MLGAHLGGADHHGAVRVVPGVPPRLVADDQQFLGLGRLAHLVQRLGRHERAGGVVGDGQHQGAGPASLAANPPHGLQQRERVGYAAALGGHRHVVRGAAGEAGHRRVPGRAGAGQQHIAADGGEQREQQGLRAGGRDQVVLLGPQAAPREIPARGRVQRGPSPDRFRLGAAGRRGESLGEFREHGQSALGRGQSRGDGLHPDLRLRGNGRPAGAVRACPSTFAEPAGPGAG